MTPTAAERLDRIRIKTEWAKEYIRNLERRIARFHDSNPYEVRAEKDAHSPNEILRIKLVRKIPDELACIIGDAVHNLRSALDHLVWQLVEAHGAMPPDERHMFPVSETLAKYQSAGSRRRIDGVHPGAVNLIDQSKPYAGGQGEFWTIHYLDIIDKHRLLLLTGFVNSGLETRVTDKSQRESAAQGVHWPGTPVVHRFASNPPGVPIMLEYGAEIQFAKVTVMTTGLPMEVDVEMKPLFDVAFADPEIVKGEPVVPKLQELAQFVEGFIPQFVPFL